MTTLDLFSQGVSFRASRDSETHKSLVGTLFSIIILALTAPYLVSRFVVLKERQDSSIRVELNENVFDYMEPLKLVVGQPNDYNYAFRLTVGVFDLKE